MNKDIYFVNHISKEERFRCQYSRRLMLTIGWLDLETCYYRFDGRPIIIGSIKLEKAMCK